MVEVEKKFSRMDFPEGMELQDSLFQHLSLDVEGEHLAGIKIAKNLEAPSDFVFVHGASGGNFSRVMTFARPVVEQGHSIVAFDHSGHGESTGFEKKSSLSKRAAEAREVIRSFSNSRPKTVCGSSMGGYVAIKMLEKYPIENLILYCPAVYDRAAYNVPFDSGFTEIIRQPGSWKKSDAGEILENFNGSLLVVIGKEDATIPKGVIELIDSHASRARRKEIMVVPHVGHAIHDYVQQHPHVAKQIAMKVAEFSE